MDSEKNVASVNIGNESAKYKSLQESLEADSIGLAIFNKSNQYENVKTSSNESKTASENEWNKEWKEEEEKKKDEDENENDDDYEEDEDDDDYEEDEDEDDDDYLDIFKRKYNFNPKYDDILSNCLRIEKPSPNWNIVSEVINLQIGSNPLFNRKFYSSLHAVERLEPLHTFTEYMDIKYMKDMKDINGIECSCVRDLNFNQKGNLLASACYNLVFIWDWTVRKKRRVTSGHFSEILQAKWLPFNIENLMVTSAEDGEVRLIDLEYIDSSKLAKHDKSANSLTVNPEIPHVVFSAGKDSRVFSIDIRESKLNVLLEVEEESLKVPLYSIHSNPSNSNEFCVSGKSFYVRVYDRRNVSKLLYKLLTRYEFVASAIYNYNGTEILASSGDKISLFNNSIWSYEPVYSPLYKDPIFKQFESLRTYNWHCGLNFFGSKSEYIMVGHSYGHVLIYDKNTGAIVQWLREYKDPDEVFDEVRCLESHPHIPILATSIGLNIKIWEPSGRESPSKSSCMKNLHDYVCDNAYHYHTYSDEETPFFNNEDDH